MIFFYWWWLIQILIWTCYDVRDWVTQCYGWNYCESEFSDIGDFIYIQSLIAFTIWYLLLVTRGSVSRLLLLLYPCYWKLLGNDCLTVTTVQSYCSSYTRLLLLLLLLILFTVYTITDWSLLYWYCYRPVASQ